MNQLIQEIARSLIEENRHREIAAMVDLTGKCRRCFHYRFVDPKGVKWDYTFVPVGYVCNYSSIEEPPFMNERNLIIWGEVRDIKNATIDGSLNDFSHVYQSKNGERTIKRRIELGECEFKEFPEPRSKSWYERDDVWDAKYKQKYVRLMAAELRKCGMEENKIQEIVAEELDFKNTVYWNER